MLAVSLFFLSGEHGKMLSIKICGHPWYGSRSNQVHANCITGLSTPGALAVPADSLFVTNLGNGTVGKYNATMGAALNANFATKLNYAGIAVAPATPTPTPSPHPVAKDFSGDGFADLVWQNTSTGQRCIWLVKNGVLSSSSYLPTTAVAWHIEVLPILTVRSCFEPCREL
jgi:hypothetical protein